jgi:hypothetical protein
MSSEALELARGAQDPVTLRWARQTRAVSLLGSPDAQALADVAGEMVGEESDLMQQAIGHRFLVAARLMVGDRHGFDAETRELERCARELRMWLFRQQVVLCHLTAAFLEAQFGEIGDRLAELGKEHVAAGTPGATGLKAHMASLLFEEGRFDDLDALEPLPSELPAPLLRAILAHGAVARGRLDDARFAVRGVVDDLPQVTACVAAWTSARLAEVVFALDDGDSAHLLRRHLAPYAGLVLVIGFGAICLGPADRSLGMIAALLGEEDGAEHHFETALRVAESLRSPLFVGHTQCDYGEFLLRRARAGDTALATRLVSAAAATAESLQMRTLARRAARVLP